MEDWCTLDPFQAGVHSCAGFNSSHALIVINHGWSLDGMMESWVLRLASTLQQSLTEVNIVVTDWLRLANQHYPIAVQNTRAVGKDIASLLRWLQDQYKLSPKRVHLIGYSLGAHISGFAGSYFRGSEKIGITGLDPAGPLFEGMSPIDRLSPDDADFVDAIHTFTHERMGLSVGTKQPVAHQDFYPNGGTFQPGCDIHNIYDHITEYGFKAYIKRVIAHPRFHNISFKQAEKMMESLDQGDLVIRPSSKGENHLTVTWKVAEGIYQHVDVREEGKENVFSLGHTLWINNEEFEDLDEITARFIKPMAAFARDLLGHKYFHECHGGDRKKMEEMLVKTKREKPTFIPYFISACKDLPGKFILGYQPRGKPRVEYVTITPDGFRYRSQMFSSVNGLFLWFKDHYQEPIPGITPSNSSRTRTPASLNATPAKINIADLTRAVNALPRSMTSQMFSAIAVVTGQGQNANSTPAQWGSSQYGYSGGGGGGSTGGGGGSSSAYHVFATPQQPTAMPMMTPSYSYTTPSQQALGTPQYPGSTPQSSHSSHHAHRSGAPGHASGTPSSSGSSRGRMPQQQPQPKSGSSSSAVDWGKMAEQWLKEKEAEGRKKTPRMTPRPSPSPMIESTPMSIAGDATQLLD